LTVDGQRATGDGRQLRAEGDFGVKSGDRRLVERRGEERKGDEMR
jgi:hypothetical protein